jgi:CheY-like chemotaxis protein
MADLRVLIVDDDELAAEIVNEFIAKSGVDCEIEWVWNGFEALVRIQESQPDVIFLDYMMPTYDGQELLRGMLRLKSATNALIAVVSSYVNDENRHEFTDLGVHFVFDKPVSVDQIHEVIARAMSEKLKRA